MHTREKIFEFWFEEDADPMYAPGYTMEHALVRVRKWLDNRAITGELRAKEYSLRQKKLKPKKVRRRKIRQRETVA